ALQNGKPVEVSPPGAGAPAGTPPGIALSLSVSGSASASSQPNPEVTRAQARVAALMAEYGLTHTFTLTWTPSRNELRQAVGKTGGVLKNVAGDTYVLNRSFDIYDDVIVPAGWLSDVGKKAVGAAVANDAADRAKGAAAAANDDAIADAAAYKAVDVRMPATSSSPDAKRKWAQEERDAQKKADDSQAEARAADALATNAEEAAGNAVVEMQTAQARSAAKASGAHADAAVDAGLMKATNGEPPANAVLVNLHRGSHSSCRFARGRLVGPPVKRP
ncbi:MAG: hypothetical protein WAM90_11360, partial [Rhodanobacter sp.]